MRQYLVHKETKAEFLVVKLDKAKGTIKLKGPNTTFVEPFDKDRIKANGYDLINRPNEPDLTAEEIGEEAA